MSKLLIDPGHGGTEPGTYGYGMVEKDVNLNVALALRDLAIGRGHVVDMTRNSDFDVSLDARVAMSNPSYDLFLSIHCNGWDGPEPEGVEAYHEVTDLSKTVARNIVYTCAEQFPGLLIRGTKDGSASGTDFRVLYCDCPGVLAELGFLSNPVDAGRLIPSNATAWAGALLDAIEAAIPPA